MLSILIPTYNHNAFPLVKIIYNQAQDLEVPFEIICRDDGSKSLTNLENIKINTLQNAKFIEASENIGRSANRLALANQATYDWLLFLDADVMPKNIHFLKNYIASINMDSEAVFGGFAYHKDHKTKDNALRFKFGKQREEVDASIRNKNPYKVVISANFIIKKMVYLKLHQTEIKKTYGTDYVFGTQLKQHAIKIKHLNNEVYHHGIDTNRDFLNKTRDAMETLINLSHSSKNLKHDISLLNTFTFLKQMKLHGVFLYVFDTFKPYLIKNLEGRNPNMLLFDFYRLGVFCSKKKLQH